MVAGVIASAEAFGGSPGGHDLQARRAPTFAGKFAFCARDGKAFIIEQLFNSQGHFNVPATVIALTRTILLRLQRREFRLPITQYVRLHADEVAHLSDLEEEFVGYFRKWLRHAFKRHLFSHWAINFFA